MSRRNAAEKRPILPDPQFNSRLATMMVARLMQHGKKSTAQRILSDAFGLINERTGGDPLELFETAVKNATPLVEVRARLRRAERGLTARGSGPDPSALRKMEEVNARIARRSNK